MKCAALFPAGLFLSAALLTAATAAPTSLRIDVDLRDAARGLFHNHEELVVTPGPLTLVSAKWIAGEHSPSGPVVDLSGVRITAQGHPLAWRRDLVNPYALHLEVPAGVTTLDIDDEYLIPSGGLFGSGPASSTCVAIFNWTLTTLYPLGPTAAEIQTQPSLTLPAGWRLGTALAVRGTEGATTHFQPVSLEQLMDSPVLAGAHFRDFDLTPAGGPAHVLHAAADSAEALELNEARLAAYRRLPAEYAALTGVRHYSSYHFLLSLTDRFGFNGIEHHQSSDNRAGESCLTDDTLFPAFASLLTHEYFHSWNGKFRRPARLLSPDYQKPMEDDLLWVYEGLTEYYGGVMAVRAGLNTEEEYREALAGTCESYAGASGRQWRTLQDTCDEAYLLYFVRPEFQSRRRGVDFYSEMALLWLQADTLIRQKTNGARSLDDFVRLFAGDGRTGAADPAKVPSEAPRVVPYEEPEVLQALNTVCPYDWAGFFQEHLKSLQPAVPMQGIESAGWHLTYNDKASTHGDSATALFGNFNQMAGLGLLVDAKSLNVVDVRQGSPADKAGLFPGQTLLAVNGRKATLPLLKAALKATQASGQIELVAESSSFVTTVRIAYSDGLRIPHLERSEKVADLLHAILSPKVPASAKP